MPVTLGNQNITSSTGNLGIGTDSPSGGLTVLRSTNDTAAPTLNLKNGGGSAKHISFQSTDDIFYGGIGRNGAAGIYVDAANALTLRVNSTERMRIDSAGRVTMPFQPAFRVNASSSHVLATGWQTVLYNASLTQRGNHYNISNSRFTAPVDGWYQFNAQYTSTINADGDGTFSLSVNGSTSDLIGSVSMPANYGSFRGRVVSGCAYLNANDYVVVLRFATGTTEARQGQVYSGWFSGFLIG